MESKNGFEWFMTALKNYAGFNGRARRREFWYFILFYYILLIGVGILDTILDTSALYLLFALAFFIPTLAVGVRRLHDTGHSGWWTLLPIVNIVFWAQDGEPSENRFGADPKLGSAGRSTFTREAPLMATSSLDQIEKLASLRDRGIITDDEFQTKKAQLL